MGGSGIYQSILDLRNYSTPALMVSDLSQIGLRQAWCFSLRAGRGIFILTIIPG